MDTIQKGIYIYKDGLDGISGNSLPEELIISDRISNEAVLIRLLCGTLKIQYHCGGQIYEFAQLVNYSIPGNDKNTIFKKTIIKNFYGLDRYTKTDKKNINKYIVANRRNHFVHEQLLSEMTSAIIWSNESPIEAFVHIYRSLEFMSYSFPLIYASKSMNYRGSYENLKKFMSGDSEGELKFFKTFLGELFKGNLLFEYEFDVFFLDGNESKIKAELQQVLHNISYTFEGNTMTVKFANVIDLLVTLRNRYFHMLVGKGTYNFHDVTYDKRDIFRAINPVFINFLAMIYREIVAYSIGVL